MPEIKSLSVFITASIIMLVTPGPAVLYIVARSVEQGRLAGIISALGIALGGLTHVIFASLGLSLILVQSAIAFGIIKYIGAAYLIYLGIIRITSQNLSDGIPNLVKKKLSQIFMQGYIVNLLNPKTALFFMAFLPQFVNPSRGSISIQIAYLGMIFISLAIISDGTYALLAGSARELFSNTRIIEKINKYIPAGIYLSLGIGTLFIKNAAK